MARREHKDGARMARREHEVLRAVKLTERNAGISLSLSDEIVSILSLRSCVARDCQIQMKEFKKKKKGAFSSQIHNRQKKTKGEKRKTKRYGHAGIWDPRTRLVPHASLVPASCLLRACFVHPFRLSLNSVYRFSLKWKRKDRSKGSITIFLPHGDSGMRGGQRGQWG